MQHIECANGTHPFYRRRGQIELPYHRQISMAIKHSPNARLENALIARLHLAHTFFGPGPHCWYMRGCPVGLGFLGRNGFRHANLIHLYCVKYYVHASAGEKTEAQSLLAAVPLFGALAHVQGCFNFCRPFI